MSIFLLRPADEARDALANLPLAGVLFLAMLGTPGERADVDSPLVLVLDAIRDTIDGGPACRRPRRPTLTFPFASRPEAKRVDHSTTRVDLQVLRR